jgi:hypothetical protein
MRFYEGTIERRNERAKSLSVLVSRLRRDVSRTFEGPILYPCLIQVGQAGPNLENSGEELVRVIWFGLCFLVVLCVIKYKSETILKLGCLILYKTIKEWTACIELSDHNF